MPRRPRPPILGALHEAEQQAGETLREIYLAVERRAPAVELCPRRLRAPRPRRDRDATSSCCSTVPAARPSHPEREVLHAVPIEVTVDGGRPLKDARGLSGQRLEIVAHLVTVAGPALRNLLACLERCHIEVKGVVAASYAAAIACLAEDELERGCLVLDFGGGTTGLAHFAGGRLTLMGQVPYGGDHITGDLAYGLSDQPAACRADQEPVRRHPVPQLRRGYPDRASAAGRPCRAAHRRGAAHADHRDRPRPGRGDPGDGASPAGRASRAAGDPAAALDRDHRRRQPARGHRGAGPGGLPPAGPLRAGPVRLVGRPPGRALLRHGRRGGRPWCSATMAA